MTKKLHMVSIAILSVSLSLKCYTLFAQEPQPKSQLCTFTGFELKNPQRFVEYKGKKLPFCCSNCVSNFKYAVIAKKDKIVALWELRTEKKELEDRLNVVKEKIDAIGNPMK